VSRVLGTTRTKRTDVRPRREKVERGIVER
jgi:hypothetical protein